MTEKPTRRPRVLIVGAGFGGLAAAKRLAGQPVDVTIIDQLTQCFLKRRGRIIAGAFGV